MPCQYDSTEEMSYHMCTPWSPGIAIYALLVSQVLLVLSICFSGCLLTQAEEDRKTKNRRKRKEE